MTTSSPPSPLIDTVLIWILAVGLLAFVLMGYDKLASKKLAPRVREQNLWIVAFLGGFAGIGVSALVFHHKVAKPTFWVPVIVSIIPWLVLLAYLLGL
jgi:uncharacterized membrane protein YsdA (DUF1294 family)